MSYEENAKVNMLRLLLGMSTLVFLVYRSFTAYAGDTPQRHSNING